MPTRTTRAGATAKTSSADEPSVSPPGDGPPVAEPTYHTRLVGE